MDGYDEDLNENPLYLYIKSENSSLFTDIIKEKWLLCLPRSDCLQMPFTSDTVLEHILIPDEIGTSYTTLKGLNLSIHSGKIVIPTSDKNIDILFSETFYENGFGKFEIICINQPLNCHKPQNFLAISSEFLKDSDRWESQPFGSFLECISILSQSAPNDFIQQIDIAIETLKTNDDLEFWSFERLSDAVREIYEKFLTDFSQFINKNDNHVLLFEISLESYIIHKLYTPLIRNVIYNTTKQNKELNCKLVYFTDIELGDLKFPISKLDSNLLTSAKYELASIAKITTPIGILKCIRETVRLLSSRHQLSSDEQLILLSYVIIKTRLPLWYSYFWFVKTFRFSSELCQESNEKSYLLCTFEAVLIYIQSKEFKDIFDESLCENAYNNGTIKEDIIYNLFGAIQRENIDDVETFLMAATKDSFDAHSKSEAIVHLCHPLCLCSKCTEILKGNETNDPLRIINNKGFSLLHVAAQKGDISIVEKLLRCRINLEAKDNYGRTSMHWAAKMGHQNTLLLLLNSGASLESLDNLENTPFHLAAAGGYDICVKAIIFYAEMKDKNGIFCKQNSRGDTPLHIASYWGYNSIVKLILEQMVLLGVELSIKNKFQQTAFDCTQNAIIINIFKEHKNIPTNFVLHNIISHEFENTPVKLYKQQLATFVPPIVNDKLDKVINAVSSADQRLLYFYLGVDEKNVNPQNMIDYNQQSLCHPLCQCEKCHKAQSAILDVSLLNCIGSLGFGVIHAAVLYENVELCETLYNFGANVKLLTKYGETILHLVVKKQNLPLLLKIDEFNLDPNARDINGNTPLHLCCIQGWSDGITYLVKSGANIKVLNKSNFTPIEEANNRGYLNIVKALLNV